MYWLIFSFITAVVILILFVSAGLAQDLGSSTGVVPVHITCVLLLILLAAEIAKTAVYYQDMEKAGELSRDASVNSLDIRYSPELKHDVLYVGRKTAAGSEIIESYKTFDTIRTSDTATAVYPQGDGLHVTLIVPKEYPVHKKHDSILDSLHKRRVAP